MDGSGPTSTLVFSDADNSDRAQRLDGGNVLMKSSVSATDTEPLFAPERCRGGVEAPETLLLLSWNFLKTASLLLLFPVIARAVEAKKTAPRHSSHCIDKMDSMVPLRNSSYKERLGAQNVPKTRKNSEVNLPPTPNMIRDQAVYNTICTALSAPNSKVAQPMARFSLSPSS